MVSRVGNRLRMLLRGTWLVPGGTALPEVTAAGDGGRTMTFYATPLDDGYLQSRLAGLATRKGLQCQFDVSGRFATRTVRVTVRGDAGAVEAFVKEASTWTTAGAV